MSGQAVARSHYRLVSVRLGEWEISKEIDCNDEDICSPRVQDIPIEELIPHEGYSPSSQAQQDDIALLRLSRPVQLNDFARTICLPVEGRMKNMTFDESLQIAGWGLSEKGNLAQSVVIVRFIQFPLAYRHQKQFEITC